MLWVTSFWNLLINPSHKLCGQDQSPIRLPLVPPAIKDLAIGSITSMLAVTFTLRFCRKKWCATFIVEGNGPGDTCSNLGRGCVHFHFTLMAAGKVWIHLISSQPWVSSREDRYGNRSRRKETLKSNHTLLKSVLLVDLVLNPTHP